MKQNQVQFDCKTCGKPCSASPSRKRKFCSPECAYADVERVSHVKPKERGNAKCEKCGMVFKITAASGIAKFCSRKCSGQAIGGITMKVNRQQSPRELFVSKPCLNCKNLFDSWASSNRKFCSQKCSAAHDETKTRRVKTFQSVAYRPNTYSRAHDGWLELGGKRLFARSLWEADYARFLQWQKERGFIVDWEHEPKTFWFEKIRRGVRSYLPDFKVFLPTGKHEWHEVKGWMDSKSKTKIARMAKYHPEESLIVIGSSWFKEANKKLSSMIPGWGVKPIPAEKKKSRTITKRKRK